MTNCPIDHPSSRRKPGTIKFFPRDQRRPRGFIQWVPAFAAKTFTHLNTLSLRRRRRGGWRAERATGGVSVQGGSLKQSICELFRPTVENFPVERPHPALRATLLALRAAEGDFAHMERDLAPTTLALWMMVEGTGLHVA